MAIYVAAKIIILKFTLQLSFETFIFHLSIPISNLKILSIFFSFWVVAKI